MRAPNRPIAAFAGAIAVLAALAGGVFVIVRDSDGRAATVDAAAEARSACRHFDAFVDIVARNGPASEATDQLDAVVAESRRAAAADPVWVQLASGMQTLRRAFADDDPEATRTALTLVRQNCARANERDQ